MRLHILALLATTTFALASAASAIEYPKTPAARAEAERLALAGNAEAAFQLGRWYHSEVLLRERSVALASVDPMVRWFRMAAEAGHVEAMNKMSGLRYTGSADEIHARSQSLVSEQETLDWLRRAADRGHVGARYVLAGRYGRGDRLVSRDPGEATRLYALNAEAGHSLSMGELGEAYLRGQGVPKDEAKALHWLQRATDAGALGHENSLGFLLHQGVPGTPPDQGRALELFRRGAERNEVNSLLSLGAYHEYGYGGLPPSYSEALAVYRRAAQHARDKTAAEQRIARVEAAMAAGRSAAAASPMPGENAPASNPSARGAATQTAGVTPGAKLTKEQFLADPIAAIQGDWEGVISSSKMEVPFELTVIRDKVIVKSVRRDRTPDADYAFLTRGLGDPGYVVAELYEVVKSTEMHDGRVNVQVRSRNWNTRDTKLPVGVACTIYFNESYHSAPKGSVQFGCSHVYVVRAAHNDKIRQSFSPRFRSWH